MGGRKRGLATVGQDDVLHADREEPRREEGVLTLVSNTALLNRMEGVVIITISDEEKG